MSIGGSAESSESSESSDASGASGVALISTGPTRPLGVSPSPCPTQFGKLTIWEGDRWPPPDSGNSLGDKSGRPSFHLPQGTGAFRYGVWEIPYFCDVVLAQFVANPAGGPGYDWSKALNTTDDAIDKHRKMVKQNGIPVAQTTADELQELVDLIPYRAGVQSEAMAQRDSILPYFRGLLSFTQASHPATYYLCMAAIRIGGFQALHFKWIFNRPSASQLCPALMPPIDPPGHASYPSGHATQSYLLVKTLEAIQPAFNTDSANPDLSALHRLAERIARNREVLGLHYPSDTIVGRKLADRSFPIFQQCQAYKDLRSIAQAEWA